MKRIGQDGSKFIKLSCMGSRSSVLNFLITSTCERMKRRRVAVPIDNETIVYLVITLSCPICGFTTWISYLASCIHVIVKFTSRARMRTSFKNDAFSSLGHATKIIVRYKNDSIEFAATESLDSSL